MLRSDQVAAVTVVERWMPACSGSAGGSENASGAPGTRWKTEQGQNRCTCAQTEILLSGNCYDWSEMLIWVTADTCAAAVHPPLKKKP